MGSSRYGPRDGPAARRCSCRYISGVQVRGGRRAPPLPPWWTKKSVGNGGGVLSLRRRRKHLSNSRETLLLRGRWLEKGQEGYHLLLLPVPLPIHARLGIGRDERGELFILDRRRKKSLGAPLTLKRRVRPPLLLFWEIRKTLKRVEGEATLHPLGEGTI